MTPDQELQEALVQLWNYYMVPAFDWMDAHWLLTIIGILTFLFLWFILSLEWGIPRTPKMVLKREKVAGISSDEKPMVLKWEKVEGTSSDENPWFYAVTPRIRGKRSTLTVEWDRELQRWVLSYDNPEYLKLEQVGSYPTHEAAQKDAKRWLEDNRDTS